MSWISYTLQSIQRLRKIESDASSLCTALAIVLLLAGPGALAAQGRYDFALTPRHVVYHDVKVDAQGAIVPWYDPSPSVAYDHDLRMLWSFWKQMRNGPNGVPYYLLHQVWKENEDDKRGLGGDQISMTMDSWNLLYGYLGDEELHRNMKMMADFWLEHGLVDAHLAYANQVYPYNMDTQLGVYNGDMRSGKGYLQPDKAASFGAQLVTLYQITEDKRYLQAAIRIANSLARTAIAGDASHSPWPFRVDAASGKSAADPWGNTVAIASYTTNWTPALRLFEKLDELHAGDTKAYRRTHTLVCAWLLRYPLQTNRWGPFFEDVATGHVTDTEINADTMAAYLFEHPGFAANAPDLARGILRWSETVLGNHQFESVHVMPLNEQTAYLFPGNSHTARHAMVELLDCERTGHCDDKQAAIRRLNWATYSVNEEGKNRYPQDDIWLTDGYGDYVRHYLRAMASLPELAPENQNHLLRSSSVIQKIQYSEGKIGYRKFDARSAECFKLGAAVPARVSGGSYRWDAKTKLLYIEARSKDVAIVFGQETRSSER
ncbi:MAG: hypothetical protein P4K83_01315 [Terracidiphilus sp.]|nr:hypothetical protein [Terracidiphilus sp.]